MRPFDETSWTDVNGPGVSAYAKSKTLAERAAWDFVAKEGRLELAVVNPVGVFGPVLGPDMSTSVAGIKRLMDGAAPGLPRIRFGVVDVRDVADLHLKAMTDQRAEGERFLAVSGKFMSMREMALTLKARMGEAARRVPTRELPDTRGGVASANLRPTSIRSSARFPGGPIALAVRLFPPLPPAPQGRLPPHRAGPGPAVGPRRRPDRGDVPASFDEVARSLTAEAAEAPDWATSRCWRNRRPPSMPGPRGPAGNGAMR